MQIMVETLKCCRQDCLSFYLLNNNNKSSQTWSQIVKYVTQAKKHRVDKTGWRKLGYVREEGHSLTSD